MCKLLKKQTSIFRAAATSATERRLRCRLQTHIRCVLDATRQPDCKIKEKQKWRTYNINVHVMNEMKDKTLRLFVIDSITWRAMLSREIQIIFNFPT